MSEAVARENPNNDLEGVIDDFQKHFKNRAKAIEDRINSIKELEENLKQSDAGKVKDFSRAKKIFKGVFAAAAKTAADVELMASQEDPLMGLETLGGLLGRLKKGISSKEKVAEEEGNNLAELVARIKDEFSIKLDSLEKRIDTLRSKSNSHYVSKIKPQSKGFSKAVHINNLGDAYKLINEMYDDLTKRFDELEKRLDKIEKGIEKKLENSPKIKKSIIDKAVEGIKGLFNNNQSDIGASSTSDLDLKQNSFEDEAEPQEKPNKYDYGPTADDMLYEFEAQARERAAELGIEIGEEPKPFKPAYSNFKFGKFDANVLFNAIKGRTDDEFKEQLYSTYNDTDKAGSEYKMQSRRIEKLKEKGYIEMKDGKYEITGMGRKAAKEVNKAFEFTSYDANIVFGYIKKNDGQLSLEMLKEGLEKDYKSKDEIDKQFAYLQKRIENNEKEGYLAKNAEGNYMITDKGKATASKILKKHKKKELAL